MLQRKVPKSAISQMETMLFTRTDVTSWIVPPFQRPLRVNEKVRALAEDLKKNGGLITGVLTLGRLKGDRSTYIVDGQHRLEAFKISELPEAIADVRTCSFDNIAEMADEFVLLQQSLVRMRPDDVLRGLEGSTPSLQIIRKTCPFVGYDQIRRNSEHSPVVGMSMVLRAWAGSKNDTPVSHKAGATSAQLIKEMEGLEVTNLCKFLHLAHSAWGHDGNYGRLWSALNIGICMWMYRRVVLDEDHTGSKRATILNTDQFKKCLMSISAAPDYIDWLANRNLSDHHRAPAYRRIKAMFATRLKEDGITEQARFPSPAWAAS
jgi:ParB-like nuclease domain